MREKGFILSEEPYKIGHFEQVPIAEENTVIVLYRKEEMGSGIVIKAGAQVLRSAIKKQHYNTKTIVNMAPMKLTFKEKVNTAEGYCDFVVDIEVEFAVKDVLKIVFEHRESPCYELESSLKRVIRSESGKHSLYRKDNLRNHIVNSFDNIKKRYPYLTMEMTEKIELDEYGTKLIDSERTAEIEKRVLQHKEEINRKKMENFQQIYEKHGDEGPLIQTMLDGEMSKRELSDILRKRKKEDRKEVIDLIYQWTKEGMLAPEQTSQFADKYVFAQTIQPVVAEKKHAAIEEIIIDDTDTY